MPLPYSPRILRMYSDLRNAYDIADVVSADLAYYGFCSPSSEGDEDFPVWSIMRVQRTGNITRYLWANGTFGYNLIWDNRATYVYHTKRF